MDKDTLPLEVAKAWIASDPNIIGDHSEFAHIWLPRVYAFLSALEAAGLIVAPNDLFVQESNHSWLAIRHRSPRFCLSAPTLDEAKAKYATAMASYAALGEKGEDNDR